MARLTKDLETTIKNKPHMVWGNTLPRVLSVHEEMKTFLSTLFIEGGVSSGMEGVVCQLWDDVSFHGTATGTQGAVYGEMMFSMLCGVTEQDRFDLSRGNAVCSGLMSRFNLIGTEGEYANVSRIKPPNLTKLQETFLPHVMQLENAHVRVPPTEAAEGSERMNVHAWRSALLISWLRHLPARQVSERAVELIGREQELAVLDLALSERRIAILSLVAWGGVGKTVLIQTWLARLQRSNWFDLSDIFAWSFHSQGAREDRQASEDFFLAQALDWFGVTTNPAAPAWEKGGQLAAAMQQRRALLILDGVEPLQHPPGPSGGRLRAPELHNFLIRVGSQGSPHTTSLCILTTREPLDSLVAPLAIQLELGNLTEDAGAALLLSAGARFVGPASISPEDTELLAASREFDGHALSLSLLGKFIQRAHSGDIRRRDLVKLEKADSNVEGGVTFRMLAAFEKWFSVGGDNGKRRLSVLSVLGLFDRPAESDWIAAIRRQPPLEGLTDHLFTNPGQAADGRDLTEPIIDEDFNEVVSYLAEFGLLTLSLLRARTTNPQALIVTP